jgi:hypothetical protein
MVMQSLAFCETLSSISMAEEDPFSLIVTYSYIFLLIFIECPVACNLKLIPAKI